MTRSRCASSRRVRTDADIIPDETSILNFRRLLESHQLTERLLAEINAHLCERGLLVGMRQSGRRNEMHY